MKPTLLHIDRTSKEQITIDDAGNVEWTRGGTPVKFTAIANKQPASFHYPNRAFFAVQDLRAFVAGVKATSERAMQWTAGDSNALYREVVRFDDRVLIVWGRNNARDLQTVGLITDDAERLVQAMRAAPLKGYKPTSSYFLEGRGGVVREYYPPTENTKRAIERAVGRCLDNRVEWTTRYPEHEYEEHVEELATDEQAERRFDALELDWYRRGGRPYEVEWMKTAKRRSQYSLYDWFRWFGERPDVQGYAMKLLEDAKLAAALLPVTHAEICEVLGQMPETRWVHVGETLGKVTQKAGRKPNTEVMLDHALHAVATVVRDKTGIRSVVVKRAKTADAAKALFEKS